VQFFNDEHSGGEGRSLLLGMSILMKLLIFFIASEKMAALSRVIQHMRRLNVKVLLWRWLK